MSNIFLLTDWRSELVSLAVQWYGGCWDVKAVLVIIKTNMTMWSLSLEPNLYKAVKGEPPVVLSTLARSRNKSDELSDRRCKPRSADPGASLPGSPPTQSSHLPTCHNSIPPHPSGLFTQTFLPNDPLSPQLQPARIMKLSGVISILFPSCSSPPASTCKIKDILPYFVLLIRRGDGRREAGTGWSPGQLSWYQWDSSGDN